MKYASEELKRDKEVVLEAVKKWGEALEYASEEFKNDKEVVLEAVKNDGYALKYASEELKNDKEVVLAAIRNTRYALEYASWRLQNDEELKKIAAGSIAKKSKSANEKDSQGNKELEAESVENNGDGQAIEQTEAETQRQEILQRVKGKIAVAKERREELESLREKAEKVGENENIEKDSHEEEKN